MKKNLTPKYTSALALISFSPPFVPVFCRVSLLMFLGGFGAAAIDGYQFNDILFVKGRRSNKVFFIYLLFLYLYLRRSSWLLKIISLCHCYCNLVSFLHIKYHCHYRQSLNMAYKRYCVLVWCPAAETEGSVAYKKKASSPVCGRLTLTVMSRSYDKLSAHFPSNAIHTTLHSLAQICIKQLYLGKIHHVCLTLAPLIGPQDDIRNPVADLVEIELWWYKFVWYHKHLAHSKHKVFWAPFCSFPFCVDNQALFRKFLWISRVTTKDGDDISSSTVIIRV